MGGKLKGAAKLAGASRGTARDLVARHTGKGHTSLAKAEAVIAAHEAEPHNMKLAKLVAVMDKCGRVDGPYRRLVNMRQAEAIRAEPPPLREQGCLIALGGASIRPGRSRRTTTTPANAAPVPIPP